MTDLLKEYVDIDINNQRLLRSRSRYLRVYRLHENGDESIIARYVKFNEHLPEGDYTFDWLDRSKSQIITAKEFNEEVIGSEKYINYFTEFPVDVLIGKDGKENV